MRMSTKSRFAVEAMIDLALRERSGPVALAQIAARQGVSLSFLEQLFSRLRRAGLVDSTRGPGGGYSLGRRPQDISLADVVASVDDLDAAQRSGAPLELTHALCAELDAVMMRHLATISIRDLAARQGAPADEPAPAVRRGLSRRGPVAAPRSLAPNSVFAFGQSFAQRV